MVFHIYSGGNHQFEVRKPTPQRPRKEGTKISAQLVNLVHQNHRIRNLPGVARFLGNLGHLLFQGQSNPSRCGDGSIPMKIPFLGG